MSSAPLPAETPMWRLLGMVYAALGVLCFSARPGVVKMMYAEVPDPILAIGLRMLIALPLFMAMAIWAAGRATERLSGREWLALGLLGLVGYYVASFLDFVGLQFVSAGLGRLILFMYPTVVTLIAFVWLKQKPTPRVLLALAVTYVGAAIVLGDAVRFDGPGVLLGATLIFGSAVAYAVYLVAGGQLTRRVGSARFTAYAMLFACAGCIIQYLIMRPVSQLGELSWRMWGLALILGTLCTVIPIFLTSEALRRVGAQPVAIIGGLAPVSAYALGWALLGEPLLPLQVVGSIIVVIGVLMVTLRKT